METIDVPDWKTFQRRVQDLREDYDKESSPLLFRGQGNSEWDLTTTLDRNTYWTVKDAPYKNAMCGMTLLDYYDLITGGVGPEVKTFSGIDVPERNKKIADSFFSDELLYQFPSTFPDMQLYRYMAYLRHLAFPSPLLDWTRSPFVAAFFAFREDSAARIEKRAIYAFCKSPTGGSGGLVGEPSIFALGPYVQTHHRHFRQRCDYTFCAAFDASIAQWRFQPHQTVFDKGDPEQDVLWKITLPSDERENVLRVLNDYNLNAFSLFGSEESLVEAMWFREYVLRESKPKKLAKPA
jgi:hypothetical protein